MIFKSIPLPSPPSQFYFNDKMKSDDSSSNKALCRQHDMSLHIYLSFDMALFFFCRRKNDLVSEKASNYEKCRAPKNEVWESKFT